MIRTCATIILSLNFGLPQHAQGNKKDGSHRGGWGYSPTWDNQPRGSQDTCPGPGWCSGKAGQMYSRRGHRKHHEKDGDMVQTHTQDVSTHNGRSKHRHHVGHNQGYLLYGTGAPYWGSDERLEEIMPKEDLTSGSDITAQVRDLDDITPQQGELLAELFEELEVAHDSLGKSKQHTGQTIKKLEWQTTTNSLESKHTPSHSNKYFGKFLERPSHTPTENRLTRRYTQKGKTDHDPRSNDGGHETWEHQQPNMSVGSHSSIQNTKEVWSWHHPEGNAGEIQSQAKTVSFLYNWEKIPRGHR